MTNLPESARIVIIGGGVMGLFTAWECASRGEKDIIILEKRMLLGAGSTQKAAGGVRAQFTTAANVRLSKYSQNFYKNRFPKEINPDFEYRQYGYLFIARSIEKLNALDRSMKLQIGLGVDAVRRITPEEIREIHPEYYIDDVLGANYSPEDGFVDPGDIVYGLDTCLRKFGVGIFTDTGVEKVISHGDFNFEVVTAQGTIKAEKVLVATGAWTGEFLRDCVTAGETSAIVTVPVLPFRRTLYISSALEWFNKRSPFTFDVETGTHFRPESGGINFLKINPDEPSSFNEEPDWEWLENIIPDLLHMMPRLEEAEIKDAWAGLYDMSPDHSAILGPLPQPASKGIYVATGFSGHGLMHAPAVGCAMAEYLMDGATSTIDVRAFRPERYAEGDEIHEAAVF